MRIETNDTNAVERGMAFRAGEVLWWLAWVCAWLFVIYSMAGAAIAGEIIGQYGDTNWARCSGSACWDESGDPRHPLPTEWKTRNGAFGLGVRLAEVELVGNYVGPGKRAVHGLYVDDQYFDSATRRVIGCPPRVIDATVDQWTAGLRATWAPRWSFAGGAAWVQPDLGVYAHHTRWAINWSRPVTARGDGGGWSATPTGGIKVGFLAHDGVTIATGIELYHRPTVQTAPLGGGGRKGPGLVLTVLELRGRI